MRSSQKTLVVDSYMELYSPVGPGSRSPHTVRSKGQQMVLFKHWIFHGVYPRNKSVTDMLSTYQLIFQYGLGNEPWTGNRTVQELAS